jgi:hypothetical protein
MNDFYARFASDRDDNDNPLFKALRELSRLDPRTLMAWNLEDSSTWSPWDATGGPPEVARIPA